MALRSVRSLSKFDSFKDKMKLTYYEAIGVLEAIWHFTGSNTPQGDIGKYSNAEIAKWIGWDRDPDELINTLLEFRWLEKHSIHRIIVHDWNDHADKSVKTGLRNKNLDFCHSEELTQIPKEISGNPEIQIGCPPRSGSGSGSSNDSPVLENGNEDAAALLAREYHFLIPGMRKPMLEDLTPQFAEKLRVYGKDKADTIRKYIKSDTRDRTAPIWEFWKGCGLADPPKAAKSKDPHYPTPDEIEARAIRLAALPQYTAEQRKKMTKEELYADQQAYAAAYRGD